MANSGINESATLQIKRVRKRMSSISKAVELARKERRPYRRGMNVPDEQPITYTRTQKVEVDRNLLGEKRVIYGVKDKSVVDSYKLLRTRLMSRMQQNKWKTLGITSAAANEGKTLTAINVAISIALKQNYTVMLVDADLRRPSVHSYFGIQPQQGLRDYLEKGTPIEEILIHPNIESLVLLPGSPSLMGSTDKSSELLASPKMGQLVEELKSRYPSRLVLFDLPPVHLGDDVVAFSPYLDTIMLVVEDGKTQSGELGRALELLEEVEIIGTVLNKSSHSSKIQDYYYYKGSE
jgi:protein-tyrosine kinase